MPRTLPVRALILAAVALAGMPSTGAGQSADQVLPVAAHVPIARAHVAGVVRDQAGAGIRGVSVLAVGGTIAMSRTDDLGRFAMSVPAGDYVLRATREGYVSTYREPVRLDADQRVQRLITLARVDPDRLQMASIGDLGASGPASESSQQPAPAPSDDRNDSDAAWRLRHLQPTVLRDVSATMLVEEPRQARESPAGPWRDGVSTPVDWLADTDLTGQVNLLTTGSLDVTGAAAPLRWPHGVAYVVLGAPVGAEGAWTVRAALTAGDLTAWTLQGEYAARAGTRHAFRTGFAYSTQVLDSASTTPVIPALPVARRVGGAYLADRWALVPGVEIGYRVRADRYDYLASPNLMSGNVSLRVDVAPRATVVARLAPRMIAPGADQFVPPASSGVWLPPERTFSPLDSLDRLAAEAVDEKAVEIEMRLHDGDAPVIRAGRFSQSTERQMATMFGLDAASAAGHYYVASPGDVQVDGWLLGISGPLGPYLRGSMDYRSGRAAWDLRAGARLLSAVPSLARAAAEQTHDVTTSVEADLPATATHVNVAYRLNSAFSVIEPRLLAPGGRFAVEVRQQLPFQPLGRGQLTLLVSARTLLRELDADGAYFDELLTLAPPLRVTCGLQMKF